MSQELIQNWLARLRDSVARQDLEAHMALVSDKVQVYGIPGQPVIDYHGWRRRRDNEFRRDRLAGLAHENIRIKTVSLRRLGFEVDEIMTASDGPVLRLRKTVLLEEEDDGQWRVVEETVHDWRIENGEPT